MLRQPRRQQGHFKLNHETGAGIIYKPSKLNLPMRNKISYTIVRILLGLAFIFFGVTKFYPIDAPLPPQPALDFLMALGNTGYFIPFLAAAEILLGLLLLANFWVPLAMMILSPIMLNVILFNAFLAPSLVSLIMLLILVALQAYIMYCTWNAYKPLFKKKTIAR